MCVVFLINCVVLCGNFCIKIWLNRFCKKLLICISASFWLLFFQIFSLLDIDTIPILSLWDMGSDTAFSHIKGSDEAVRWSHQSYYYPTIYAIARSRVGLLSLWGKVTFNPFKLSLGLCYQYVTHRSYKETNFLELPDASLQVVIIIFLLFYLENLLWGLPEIRRRFIVYGSYAVGNVGTFFYRSYMISLPFSPNSSMVFGGFWGWGSLHLYWTDNWDFTLCMEQLEQTRGYLITYEGVKAFLSRLITLP